jgi:hypothetical protein
MQSIKEDDLKEQMTSELCLVTLFLKDVYFNTEHKMALWL